MIILHKKISKAAIGYKKKIIVECYKSLMAKFPEEAKRYHVDFCIECAEGFLDDTVEDSDSNQPRKKRGKR